jgi:4-hydroxyacetophenone monooxygenase
VALGHPTGSHGVGARGFTVRMESRPPADQVARAVADGDLRILLMCLVHLTGDRRWLEPPYRPVRDVRLVADPRAGLADDVAAEIRAAVHDLLVDGPPEPAITDPGDELMRTMMSVCLGEAVPPEYAGMMREDMGFVSRDVGLVPPPPTSHVDVVIIGAGVSGLALGAQLERLGVPYTILERNDDVGGTWFDNRYPGCGVDTPNHAYSFSFGRRHQWSRYFSLRDEIQDYLLRAADEFGVREHIRFDTEVTGARWDEREQRWTITARRRDGGNDVLSASVLVSALGMLNVPKLPQIEGIDRFQGPLFHSARWPDELDLDGAAVAVIGTGASAMQLVPAIAGQAGSVTVYQRSPQWARPIDGYRDEIPPGARWLLEHLPFYVEWFRFSMLWRYGDGLLPLLRRDPAWPYPDRAMNRINDRHRQEMTDFIVEQLGDRTDLVDVCVPDYPPYGKRILLDNGWFTALTRPDVHLVTTPVDHLDDGAVITVDGTRRAADVVVMATGFQTTELTSRLDVVGRNGRRLADAWADDNPAAHLGITVPEFPNLFLMGGPNTGLGHGGSAMFQAECQARYITAILLRMAGEHLGSVEVRREVHDDYVRRVDDAHAELIWIHPGMTNWYRNRHGRITAIMPWRLVDYWAMTHDPELSEFTTSPAGGARSIR